MGKRRVARLMSLPDVICLRKASGTSLTSGRADMGNAVDEALSRSGDGIRCGCRPVVTVVCGILSHWACRLAPATACLVEEPPCGGDCGVLDPADAEVEAMVVALPSVVPVLDGVAFAVSLSGVMVCAGGSLSGLA